LALAQSLHEQLDQADALIEIGRARFLLGEPGAARSAFEAALALYRAVRHPVVDARAELYLGRTSSGQTAYDHLDRAASLFEGAGERRGLAEALLTLGKKSLEEGALILAYGCLREAAALFDEVGDPTSVAEAEEALERVKTWPN
jgi:tetratricopeptide (TPR) repeat protein